MTKRQKRPSRNEQTRQRRALYPDCPKPWKQRFEDETEAKAALSLRTVGSWARSSYHYCHGCEGFHITSRAPDGRFRFR